MEVTQRFVLGLDAPASRGKPSSRSITGFVLGNGQQGAPQLQDSHSTVLAGSLKLSRVGLEKDDGDEGDVLTCLRPRFLPNGGCNRRLCCPGSLCTLATLVQLITCTHTDTHTHINRKTQIHHREGIKHRPVCVRSLTTRCHCYSTKSLDTRMFTDTRSQRGNRAAMIHTLRTHQGRGGAGAATDNRNLCGDVNVIIYGFTGHLKCEPSASLKVTVSESEVSVLVPVAAPVPVPPTDWDPETDAQFDQ